MKWLIEPFPGFNAVDDPETIDNCSGGGTLDSCTTRGSLIVCKCTGGMVVKEA